MYQETTDRKIPKYLLKIIPNTCAQIPIYCMDENGGHKVTYTENLFGPLDQSS